MFDCKRTSSLLATVLNIRSLEVTWTETLAATLQAADNNQLFTRSRYLYRLQQLQQTMHSLQQQLPRHPVACNESCKWTHRTLRTEQLWRPQWTRSSTAVRAHETHVEFQVGGCPRRKQRMIYIQQSSTHIRYALQRDDGSGSSWFWRCALCSTIHGILARLQGSVTWSSAAHDDNCASAE